MLTLMAGCAQSAQQRGAPHIASSGALSAADPSALITTASGDPQTAARAAAESAARRAADSMRSRGISSTIVNSAAAQSAAAVKAAAAAKAAQASAGRAPQRPQPPVPAGATTAAVPDPLRGTWRATRIVTDGESEPAPTGSYGSIQLTATDLIDQSAPLCPGQSAPTAALYRNAGHWVGHWVTRSTASTAACAGGVISVAQGRWSEEVGSTLDLLMPSFTATRQRDTLTLSGPHISADFVAS